MSPKQDRGALLALKLMIPERIYRAMTRPAAVVLRRLPVHSLYKAGLKSRANRFPYKVVEDGDLVVQIGAPRDLLKVGRSRAVYFFNLVGAGRVVVFEPVPESIEEMTRFVETSKFKDHVTIIPKGAWSKDDELVFLSSPDHPASNLVQGALDVSDEDLKRRGYETLRVPVTTVDGVLAEHNLPVPKLISITTNGSEPEILKGMQQAIANGVEYIALALTGDRYTEMMADYGYKLVAYDDRGCTFQKN